jgi:microcystin-dependent protein
MPIDFPTSPTTGQVYTYLGKSWVYNGTGWDAPRAGSLNLENLVPPGTINQYAGATVPAGYLFCQGQSLSTTTYGNLFNAIGYAYGGSGSSFTLPNLQNRVPVGKGPDAEFDTLGETGGAKTHTLTTAEMPSHTHTGSTSTNGGHTHGTTHYNGSFRTPAGTGGETAALDGPTYGENRQSTYAGDHSHSFTTAATGGGGAHNNLQPYIVLNYIIKT